MGRTAGTGTLRANRKARVTQVEQQDLKPSKKEALMKGLETKEKS